MKDATRAIHGKEGADHSFRQGLASPISPSTTFWFNSVAEADAAFLGENANYVYSRGRNPVLEELEEKMTLLEGGGFCVSFASGMGAIATLLLSLLQGGGKAGYHKVLYGSSHNLLGSILPRLGIETFEKDFSREEDLLSLREAGVRAVFLESPCNPSLEVLDISRIRELLGPEVKIIVDNTFATPLLQKPLALGADFSVHSASKYIGGHGDALGGLVVGKDPGYDPILRYDAMCEFGAVLSPYNAWLFLRGLKTLPLRMQAHCRGAQAVAEFLAAHPRVERVFYPGLPGDPGYALATRQMKGYGGMVSFLLRGDEKAAISFVEGLGLFRLAVSLGDAESLVQLPWRMTHRSYQEGEDAFNPLLIRLSVGLEEPEDLLEDLARSLEALA